MLQLSDVKKSYVEPNGDVLPVLDIATFSVEPGEQMVIVGRSGCGKSTLLHVIAGISRVDQGHVMVDGIDIANLAESIRDRFRADTIGYVFQTFNLLPAFTALENVTLGMTFAKGRNDSRRASDLLDRVGLSHRLTHKPGTMSVGEQQRVAVARALATRPKLLLAAEPPANVDPGNQQQIVDLIRTTCSEENVSVIVVTHTPEVANQFDRVVHLDEINQVRGLSEQPTD